MFSKELSIESEKKGLGFANRVYRLRCIGFLVAGLCTAAILIEQRASAWLFVALALGSLAWPHVAYHWARRAHRPINAEYRNMLIDAALGGFGVAAMHFSLLPGVLVLLILGMNNMAAGGLRLFATGLGVSLLAAVAGGVLLGFELDQARYSTASLFACLPMLVLYPLMLGKMTYDMSVELAERSRNMRRLSERDHLTGLFNRGRLVTRLEEMLDAARGTQALVSVLFIDLDHFKTVNDSLGHAEADRLLCAIGERLSACVSGTDAVARYGGDEFVVATTLPDDEQVGALLENLLSEISQPVFSAGRELFVEASIGISTFPQDGEHAGILLKNADVAMYFAKQQGRNRYEYYFSQLDSESDQRLELTTELRKAFKAGELFVLYQPQVDMRTGLLHGVEALVRWQRQSGVFVSPSVFIAIAEETGLINKLGEWVLECACKQGRAWQDSGLRPLNISVNLSPIQLRRPDFVNTVEAVLERTGFDAAQLELEITEGALMEGAEQCAALLNHLRGLGITIAVDDFGTGYSSLNYLKKFRVDRIKIDQTFVRDIGVDDDNEAITRAIIALAKALHFRVIAEGVETAAQRGFLLDHGCTDAQGFFYSAAVEAGAIAAMLGSDGHFPAAPGAAGAAAAELAAHGGGGA